jgi:hypothetical protein
VFAPHAPGSREYLAVERGDLLLTVDGATYTLAAGDSIYYCGDCAHGFANPGEQVCEYYLAMELSPAPANGWHIQSAAKRITEAAYECQARNDRRSTSSRDGRPGRVCVDGR